jgi:hypothetical protein
MANHLQTISLYDDNCFIENVARHLRPSENGKENNLSNSGCRDNA